ncbi:MAG: hypothetical protein ABW007_19090 [Chitinophagaceae bacterium]
MKLTVRELSELMQFIAEENRPVSMCLEATKACRDCDNDYKPSDLATVAEMPLFNFESALGLLERGAYAVKYKDWPDHSFIFISSHASNPKTPTLFFCQLSATEVSFAKFRPSTEYILEDCWTISPHKQPDISMWVNGENPKTPYGKTIMYIKDSPN